MPKKELKEEIKEVKSSKDSFDVVNSTGGFIRTYSVELHGADAEKLAKEYAGKINGEVR